MILNKIKNIKNKGFFTLYIIFFLSFIADLMSTLANGELVQYLEANPLYRFGGLPLIIFYNLVVLVAIYYFYNKTKNPFSRYCFIVAIVSITIVRIGVIITNFHVAANPPTIEQAQAITQVVKQKYYFKMVFEFLIYLLNPILTYFFFSKDHKITLKEETKNE